MMNKINKVAVHAMAAMSSAKKQKGASSLEYVMLAAVIVAILVVLSQSDVGDTLVDAFNDVIGAASDTATETSSGG